MADVTATKVRTNQDRLEELLTTFRETAEAQGSLESVAFIDWLRVAPDATEAERRARFSGTMSIVSNLVVNLPGMAETMSRALTRILTEGTRIPIKK